MGIQRVPNLLRWTVLACCLPYPGDPKSAIDCFFLFGISLHPGVTGSAPHWKFRGCRVHSFPSPQELLRPASWLALLSRTFTFELAPTRSPSISVEYDYVDKQSIPTAGLSPASPTALWAAGHRISLTPDFRVFSGKNDGLTPDFDTGFRELADRSALVPDFTKQKELVDAYSARWRNLAEEMGAITFSARPQWRVIMGLGTNDILEGGIVLHPIFGFPTLPATSLKGVSRAYAQWVLERPEQELDALLGMVDEDESRCGDLVFLEGSPVTPPVLERDVVNPIFGPYYRDSKTPPANYLSPQPIFFLALNAGSSYQFGVASLSGDQTAARQGVGWLQGALIDLGVGAKSAAGYGYWILE